VRNAGKKGRGKCQKGFGPLSILQFVRFGEKERKERSRRGERKKESDVRVGSAFERGRGGKKRGGKERRGGRWFLGGGKEGWGGYEIAMIGGHRPHQKREEESRSSIALVGKRERGVEGARALSPSYGIRKKGGKGGEKGWLRRPVTSEREKGENKNRMDVVNWLEKASLYGEKHAEIGPL